MVEGEAYDSKYPLFCFGIYPPDGLTDVGDLVRVVKAGEASGFDIVQFPEHTLAPRESERIFQNRTWWDLPTLFSFLAGHTTTMRFLLGVSVLPNHNPINFAKALATLDHMSGGRLILGVGTGWYEEEAENLGYSFSERGAITDEYLAAIQELWASDDPHFEGRYISFSDVSFYPKPLQKPRPPTLIGGTGQRPFRRVAALGDGWYPMTGTREQVRDQFQEVRALTRDFGRDPESLWLNQSITWMNPGLAEATISRVHDSSETTTDTEITVANGKKVVEEIQSLLEMGVTMVSFTFSWASPEELIGQLAHVGRDVISTFRNRWN